MRLGFSESRGDLMGSKDRQGRFRNVKEIVRGDLDESKGSSREIWKCQRDLQRDSEVSKRPSKRL